MARLIEVGEAHEISSGQGTLVQAEGNDIALFNVNGTYRAMGAICPHEDGPLHEGEVDGDTVICPWHGYDFNVKTGACPVDFELRVLTYVVKAEGNHVCIELA